MDWFCVCRRHWPCHSFGERGRAAAPPPETRVGGVGSQQSKDQRTAPGQQHPLEPAPKPQEQRPVEFNDKLTEANEIQKAKREPWKTMECKGQQWKAIKSKGKEHLQRTYWKSILKQKARKVMRTLGAKKTHDMANQSKDKGFHWSPVEKIKTTISSMMYMQK